MISELFTQLLGGQSSDDKAKLQALDQSQAVIEFNMDGTIISANDNFLNAMGYSLSEIKGQHHKMFVTNDLASSREYQAFWDKLNQGEFQSAEFPRVNKKGEVIWIQATYNPLRDKKGNLYKVVKFATDITSQKKTAADHQGQLDAISKSQAVIEFETDGTIITANDNFLITLGYDLNEIQGQHHRMFVAPEEANSTEYKLFWETLSRGEYQSGEFRRIDKQGKEIWIQASYNPIFDLSGKPYKVVKYASNITDEKQKNAYFNGQIQAINKSQAVIEFETDGTIITANDNFLGAVGYSLDEIKGQHHRLFMDPEEASSQEYQQFWQNLGKGQLEQGEFKRVGKGGKEIWIQGSYNPIFDHTGKPFRVVKYATDITAEKMKNVDFSGQLEAIGKSQAIIEFKMDGTIISANENFLNTMGYSLEEIQGQHHSMFAPPGVSESRAYKEFWEKLNQGKFESDEFLRIGKNNKKVWIQASYNPIFDLNGNPFKVVKYATDITNRKTATEKIDNALMELSQGNLRNTIEDDLGEFNTLRDALNNTLDRLSSMVEEIITSANSVAQTADEIEKATIDLSGRTESQAATLEETSATSEELMATVRNNADNANSANRLASKATQVAETGGITVGNAVAAMEEIEKSSSKISDIINVIDDIAFQTNLLALNAAVEAARAGDQGRGFAVVAGEVRSLAQRSADSAREIKSLINESVTKVSDGARMVNESGETLGDIVNAIKEVSVLIADIDSASQEQSEGINQVSDAINQMENVTQQNAAMVEEASASCGNMSQDANNLLNLVKFFS